MELWILRWRWTKVIREQRSVTAINGSDRLLCYVFITDIKMMMRKHGNADRCDDWRDRVGRLRRVVARQDFYNCAKVKWLVRWWRCCSKEELLGKAVVAVVVATVPGTRPRIQVTPYRLGVAYVQLYRYCTQRPRYYVIPGSLSEVPMSIYLVAKNEKWIAFMVSLPKMGGIAWRDLHYVPYS